VTRDEGVALIKQQLAFRQNRDAEIVSNLQLAQQMIEIGPTKPWFMYSERSSTTTTANEQRVLVPPSFIEEIDEEGLVYVDSDGEAHDLTKDEYDVLKRNFADSEPGEPEAYALMGEYFWIFPTPDDSYTIRMMHIERQVLLTSNVENNWLKWCPYLLLGTALKQIAMGPLRDTVASGVADTWIAVGAKLLATQNEARNLANRTLQMGGPHA